MLKATLAVAYVAAIALAPAYGQEKLDKIGCRARPRRRLKA